MSLSDRYPAQVFWSDEDEGFIAIAPDLPGCSAFGDTQGEALAELQDAIEAWREAAAKAGNRVPQPSQPALGYSGKFLLRMPRALHAQLATTAQAEGVSLNTYLNVLLAGAHEIRRAQQASQLTQLTTLVWSGFQDAHSNLHLETAQRLFTSSYHGAIGPVVRVTSSGPPVLGSATRQRKRA